MDLLVSKVDDMWVMHVGKYKIDSPPIPLVSASKNLHRLVMAIKSVHPESRVWIDPSITDNPFLSRRLLSNRHYNLTPFYEEVQHALDNPRIKECSLCHGRAYYNTDVRVWVCSKCGAHESYMDEARFFKLSRNAGRTRMH